MFVKWLPTAKEPTENIVVKEPHILNALRTLTLYTCRHEHPPPPQKKAVKCDWKKIPYNIQVCDTLFFLRQLQEARARVAHLFKQTNENVQVGCNDVIRNKYKLEQLYWNYRELDYNEPQWVWNSGFLQCSTKMIM